MKAFMPRDKVVKQMFYPDIDDRFEVHGTMMGF
jgi:hypothetical protein